ncbi:nitrate reductase [NADH] 3-like isoform X4 [Leguminivora glycinivorella]|uniref:nitrate reductase [NADH] 3-like isoform X4 n=1 Tax=Leguminivora glycinivorella TaxID=1035111 RepID=UPI00200BA40B|nr:nitrate reductase [NADH] 3-like isoform X4 [Leguminivora glycinivorella]
MTKVITRAEVKKNRSRRNLWLIIHDDVYDVTKFLEEHPGGEDTLLDAAGSDATQAFEDVGHSEDARELLKQYKIGSLPDDEKAKQPVPVQACCKRPRCPRNSKTCAKDCTSSNRKNSCSDCNSVASPLTAKSSRGTRFVVPPDKCDETPTSTSAAGKIVADCPHSPAVHKKAKKGCEKKRPRGLPCDQCGGGSNWKWLALAALILGAIAVGAMVVKKNA